MMNFKESFRETTESSSPEIIDRTAEFTALLDDFSQTMNEISANYPAIKRLEVLLGNDLGESTEIIRQQYELLKGTQELKRKKLDETAQKLREGGQGFMINGYEDRLQQLQ